MISFNELLAIQSYSIDEKLDFVNSRHSDNVIDHLFRVKDSYFKHQSIMMMEWTNGATLMLEREHVLPFDKQDLLIDLYRYRDRNINIDVPGFVSATDDDLNILSAIVYGDTRCFSREQLTDIRDSVPLQLYRTAANWCDHVYKTLENYDLFRLNDDARAPITRDRIASWMLGETVCDVEAATRNQLLLMSNYNFLYTDFSKMTVLEVNKFIKACNALEKEKSQDE